MSGAPVPTTSSDYFIRIFFGVVTISTWKPFRLWRTVAAMKPKKEAAQMPPVMAAPEAVRQKGAQEKGCNSRERR